MKNNGGDAADGAFCGQAGLYTQGGKKSDTLTSDKKTVCSKLNCILNQRYTIDEL